MILYHLPENPYEADAFAPEGTYRTDIMTANGVIATGQAILALAYEQRTESLIMFLGELEGEQRDQVEATIRIRLGLNGDHK
jgi:hypothetical protein